MLESNKKTIRVSDDTMKILGKERKGFETPDQCLQRILSGLSCKNIENQNENTKHESYYDSLGNYCTYDEERKTWICHVDSKNMSIVE